MTKDTNNNNENENSACLNNATDAALLEKASSLVDCVILIDDNEVKVDASTTRAKRAEKLETLAHKLADGLSSSKMKGKQSKTRGLQSGVFICTNFDPPSGKRRILSVKFDALASNVTVVSNNAKDALRKLRKQAYLALPMIFKRIKFNTAAIDALSNAFDNIPIPVDMKPWYAYWLYFTVEYAKLVSNLTKKEVTKQFCRVVILDHAEQVEDDEELSKGKEEEEEDGSFSNAQQPIDLPDEIVIDEELKNRFLKHIRETGQLPLEDRRFGSGSGDKAWVLHPSEINGASYKDEYYGLRLEQLFQEMGLTQEQKSQLKGFLCKECLKSTDNRHNVSITTSFCGKAVRYWLLKREVIDNTI